MVVDYLSSQPNRAGYQVSTKQGSGPEALDYATPQEVETEYYLTQPINTGP